MQNITTIQDFFKYGLDRDIPDLLAPPEGMHLNLGPGKRKIVHGTVGVGFPGPMTDVVWDANATPLDELFGHETIAAIHCYQFIEHFSGPHAVRLLKEMENILMQDGVIYIACPYYKSAMAYQALDHRSWWNEEIWHWLFGNEYYDDHESEPWRLQVHACFIMGIVERNINLFTQLVKR